MRVCSGCFSSFTLLPDSAPFPTSLISTAPFRFYFFSPAAVGRRGWSSVLTQLAERSRFSHTSSLVKPSGSPRSNVLVAGEAFKVSTGIPLPEELLFPPGHPRHPAPSFSCAQGISPSDTCSVHITFPTPQSAEGMGVFLFCFSLHP